MGSEDYIQSTSLRTESVIARSRRNKATGPQERVKKDGSMYNDRPNKLCLFYSIYCDNTFIYDQP